ncbi:MAG: preprotein translocase subunit YajC [Deltaproteobacteria bacterium]
MNGQAPGGALMQLAPFILILAVFYFLLIRPQQKKARETQSMLDGLKPGDQIVTSGGIYGKIVRVQDAEVALEIAPNVKIRLERSSIGHLAGTGKATEEKK